MKKILLLAVFVTLFLASCYKDKGNNDYTAIGEITIAGVEDKYSKFSFEESLTITPAVTTDYPETDLEYLWICYPQDKSTVGAIDTISREKNLDYELVLPVGNYYVNFQVRNKINGYRAFKQVSLEATTRFLRGFYVLRENSDGNTEMDLHIDAGNKVEDLLEKSLGKALDGKPAMLGVNFRYPFIDKKENKMTYGAVIAPISQKETRIMHITDMQEIYTFGEMFFEGRDGSEIPYYFTRCVYRAYLVTNKGVYSNDNMSLSSGKFGYPADPAGTSRFIVSCSDNLGIFYYDEVGRRFLCTDWSGSPRSFSEDGLPHSPNNIPHECLYLGMFWNNALGTFVYAVFQDKDNPSQRLLYKMTFGMFSYTNPIKDVATLGADLGTSSAVRYATNGKDVRMLYSVTADNELYAYNIETGAEVALTPAGLPADEDITYIAHKFWGGSKDVANNFNYFAVATHKGGKYKVFLYEMLGGQPVGNPVIKFEGEGKVADMQYATPSFTYGDYGGDGWYYQ